MSEQPHDSKLFDRYLGILKLEREKPEYESLCRIVTAHLTRVPFENISKLHYRKTEDRRTNPTLTQYLDGIERHNFGGTCYSNNYYLFLLLQHLGYDVRLCGCDMNRPDVHIVSMVKVDGREYMVDVGYAAPFFEPLPRDLDCEYLVEGGIDRYVLRPQDGEGRSKLALIRDGEIRHGYLAKPIPRGIEHFKPAIDRSYTDEATFMNSLLLVKFWPGRSLRIFNLSLMEAAGRKYQEHQLEDRKELVDAVVHRFGMPREMVAEAVASLGEFGDAWT